MKILIFGRGVIGALYGWALEKAGHTVEFYVRAGRKAHFGTVLALDFYDTRTRTMGARVRANWPITMREEIPVDNDYDLIVVSVQPQAFAAAASALQGKVAKATVLIFSNFWTDPLRSVSLLPGNQLAWGFPAAGGSFDARGVLHGGLLKQVQFGTFGTDPSTREVAVRDVFSRAGFKIKEHRDFRSWLWIHFAVNAGFHLQALRAGSVKLAFQLLPQAHGAVLNVRELIPVLKARGVDIVHDANDLAPYKLPPWVGAALLKMAADFFPPMAASLEHNELREELRTFCREVYAEARRLGISVPRFAASASLFEREKE